MQLDSFGRLSIRTFTAGGALPVADTIVRIRGAMEENRDVEYTLTTDVDGITEKISLPTSSIAYSQSPNPAEAPFANYDIEIFKEGYYGKRIYNLPIFDGVDTTLPVNMIPIEDVNNTELYPRDNLDTFIYEDLEEL